MAIFATVRGNFTRLSGAFLGMTGPRGIRDAATFLQASVFLSPLPVALRYMRLHGTTTASPGHDPSFASRHVKVPSLTVVAHHPRRPSANL